MDNVRTTYWDLNDKPQQYFQTAEPHASEHVTSVRIFVTFLSNVVASDAPTFVKTLASHSLKMGQKLHLECTFTGAEKMFVTWYKDGKQLYASYRYNTKLIGNSCIIEALHESNSETTGRYSCEISNSYGSDICHAQINFGTGV